MNQNFSKSKNFTRILLWSIFNGGKDFEGENSGGEGGVKLLDLSKSLDFKQLSYF